MKPREETGAGSSPATGCVTSAVEAVQPCSRCSAVSGGCAEASRESLAVELARRVRHLDCLYGIARLVELPHATEKSIIEGTLALLPAALEGGHQTVVRTLMDGSRYGDRTESGVEVLRARDILVRGERVGVLEVGREEGAPRVRLEPTEIELIDAVAERLGRIIERIRVARERDELREKLAQVRRMDALGQLAVGFAHDFGNLLTVIRGHADHLADLVGDDPRAKELLGPMRQATAQGIELTRGLLLFGRKGDDEQEMTDVAELVTEVTSILKHTLRPGVVLEVENGEVEAWLPVRGKSVRLRQVLLNLALNAQDAMPDGGVLRIVQRCSGDVGTKVQSEGGWVTLEVSDTGAGIPRERLARIFEPFYTTKPRERGTGLGLAIARSIVEGLGGEIGVESRLGEGTTFRVVLPRCSAEAGPAVPARGCVRSRAGGELVLLADDDPHVLGIMALTLRSQGYCVMHAADGEEALATARRHRDELRLLLVDAVMPVRSGLDCLAALRAEGVETPAIVFTGAPEVTEETLDARSTLLRKPFGMDELADVAARLTGLTHSGEVGV